MLTNKRRDKILNMMEEYCHTVLINDLKVNYFDSGSSKDALLFLHGWAAPISLYLPVFLKLKEKYRVLAFEMPGVGSTDEPQNAMTLDDYVAFTLAFCERLGISRAILMGHSHGGRIACRILSDPDCPLRTPKAVLIDAAGVPPHRSLGFRLRQKCYKALKSLAMAAITGPLFKSAYEKARERRASDDYRNATPVMRQTLTNLLATDLTTVMGSISVPVLLIWGEHDTATPIEQGREMERLIPEAGLAVILGAGHFPFLDNWAAVFGCT